MMNKPHAYDLAEWEAEQQRLRVAKKNKSGTVHKHQLRVADYALNLLKLENEAMTQRLKSARAWNTA